MIVKHRFNTRTKATETSTGNLQGATFSEASSALANGSMRNAISQDNSSTTQDLKSHSVVIDTQDAAVAGERHPKHASELSDPSKPATPPSTSNPPPYLLTIPPEIRSEILKYVLVSLEPIRIDDQYYRPKWYREFPVAWTCHQLHAEAIPIYLNQNTFSFLIGNGSYGRLKRKWLKRIGEKNWPLIRSLKIRMWPGDPWPDLDIFRGLRRIETNHQIFDVEAYRVFRENGKLICQEHE